MKQKLIFILVLLFAKAHAQLGVGVYFINGPFIIKSGTVFSSDGLVLTPASDFDLTSAVPNQLERYNAVLPAHAVPQTYISRVYRWGNATPAFTGDVTVYYQLSELNGIPQNQLGLEEYGGSGWQWYAPTLRDNTNLFVYTQTVPTTALSELTLASLLAPLPVRWGPINAERTIGLNATVRWTTFDERDVADYTVEKSLDAITWDETGVPQHATNTASQQLYGITDEAGMSKVYYRIKARELNGATHTSAIVSVPAVAAGSGILVYPNPSTEVLIVSSPSSGPCIRNIALYNAAGALVKQVDVGAVHQCQISLAGLPAGIYTVLTFTVDDKKTVTKVIKAPN